MKYLVFTCMAILLFSCGGDDSSQEVEAVDGGPCTYKDTMLIISSTRFEHLTDGRYNVWLTELGQDESEADLSISADELENEFSNIHDTLWKDPFLKYNVYKKDITEGTCTPEIIDSIVPNFRMHDRLEKNETVLNFFSPSEAKLLQDIRDFFFKEITYITDCGYQGFEDCYAAYITLLEEDDSDYLIDIEAQEEMFDGLNLEIFNKIWTLNTEHLYLDVSPDFAYGEFILDAGRDIAPLRGYRTALSKSNGLDDHNSDHPIRSAEIYDMTDARLQLVMAVHFLTLNYRQHQLAGTE